MLHTGDVDGADLRHGHRSPHSVRASENDLGTDPSGLPEFYEAARRAGLSDERADHLLEELRETGRASRPGRKRRLTPDGVDRRIVRQVLEALGGVQ